MKQRTTLKKILFTTASAAVLLLTSCPQDITPIKVALAEDTMEPKIVIESPLGGDYFYSTVTVRGIIYDDVMDEGDEAGSLSSIYFTIANDETRRGKINFNADDSFTADTTFGDINIAYDLSSKEFSFEFPTTDPYLRDRITLTITAEDKNGNSIKSELSLVENDGPVINFGFYAESHDDYSSASKLYSLSGNEVYIAGWVSDSDSEEDTDSADEIVELTWSVVGTSLSGTLDLRETTEDWDADQGVYSHPNKLDPAESFFFDPELRQFSTVTSIDIGDGAYFKVTAEDKYGHITEEQQLLTPPSNLMLLSFDSVSPYYSDNVIDIPFTGSLLDPNDGDVVDTEISSAVLTFSSKVVGVTPPSDYTITDFALDGDDNFTFTLNTTSMTAFNVNLNATLLITDDQGDTINTKYVTLINDSVEPTVSVTGFTGSNGNYLNPNDTATLVFTVNDDNSGFNQIENLKIYNQYPKTLNASGSTYTATFDFDTVPASADAGNSIDYEITISDNAGNTKTETDSGLYFYSPFTASDIYTLQASTPSSSNDVSGASTWLRATGSPEYDTLKIYFTVDRVLNGKPVITVSGSTGGSFEIPSSDIVYSESNSRWEADYVMQDDDLTDQSQLTIEIELTDAAGNPSSSDIITTNLYYDNSAPTGTPAAPVKTGSYPIYINASDMSGSVTMTVDASTSGAIDGDVIRLYLGSDSDTGTQLVQTTYNSSVNPTPLTFSAAIPLAGADGDRSFVAKISDSAGNFGPDSEVATLEKDTVVDSYNAGSSYSGSSSKEAAFTQTTATAADDNGYTVLWAITPSGATMADDTALNVNITGASDNTYTATMTVTDGAGNSENPSFNFVWDTADPTVSFSGEPSGWINAVSSDVTVTATGTDAGSGVNTGTYTWSVVASGTSTEVYTTTGTTITLNDTNFSTDGSYTVTATVEDQLGNSGSSSFDFDIDTSLPTASITELGTAWYNTDFTIDATASDSLDSSLTYSWNLTGPGSFTGAASLLQSEDLYISATVLPNSGTYTAELTVTDDAGNPKIVSDTFKWDPNAPTITAIDDYYITGNNNLDSSASDETNGSDSLTYNWSITGPTAYSDAAYDTDATFSLHVADLTDGAGIYSVTLTVTDAAGNPAEELFNVYYDYDNTNPVIDLTSCPPTGGSATYIYTITNEVTDTISGVDTSSYEWNVYDTAATPNLMGTLSGTTLTLVNAATGASDDIELTTSGTYTVYFTADDIHSNSTTESFTLIWTIP